MTAIIKSSRREVPILVEGNEFYVLRPLTRNDIGLRAMFGLVPVSGPFRLDDPRFEVREAEFVGSEGGSL